MKLGVGGLVSKYAIPSGLLPSYGRDPISFMVHKVEADMTTRALPLALGCSALLASNAYAHPRVKSTVPAENETVAKSPTTIQIELTERRVLKFSGIELLNASNQAVPVGPSEALAGNTKVLVPPIKSKLDPGDYTVLWHPVAADTHRVEGRYMFHIKP